MRIMRFSKTASNNSTSSLEVPLSLQGWHILYILISGQCLCGAGGGGFLALISKQPNAVKIIENELSTVAVSW